jgi:NADP-dependent 3-hydroxy acid dehydrogenase YdfG
MAALEGKVGIITGGTSGIGARTAELFVQEGAKVVIAARRRDQGEALAKRLGASTSYFPVDVRREADVRAMIAHAVTKFGRLDCLSTTRVTLDRLRVSLRWTSITSVTSWLSTCEA